MKYILREWCFAKVDDRHTVVLQTLALGPWETRTEANDMLGNLLRVDELDGNWSRTRGSVKSGHVYVEFDNGPAGSVLVVQYKVTRVPDGVAKCVKAYNDAHRHLEPEEMTMQEAWHQYLLDNGMSEEDYPLEEFMPSYLKGEP